MRESCLYCSLKHISKAIILSSEAQLGYPAHHWLALGNISEAEDELVHDYPEFANKIRSIRLKIEEDPTQSILLIDLLYEMADLINDE